MRLFYISIFTLLFLSLCGQRKNIDYKYFIKKANSPIIIDGNLNEEDWSKAQVANNFFMILPSDTSLANLKTEVSLTYDDENLYFSAINYLPHQKYMVESLRRDWNFQKNDNFLIALDTYNDISNGFAFGSNASGAQWDGQQFDGASVNLNWDNIWYSEVKQYDDRWVLEGSIPFKSIRFNPAMKTWGVNFGRNDLYSTEKSSWAPVPRQFPSISSAYMGEIVWEDSPKTKGRNVSIIPYVLGGVIKNIENKTTDYKSNIGGDVKLALSSSLNLDLTVNPDFSQVEVDRQQTNLDRFELFFPERRQFFLENDDLFNNLGSERIKPFFSRRIGLNVPINYGARLSGKLSKSLRIGLMNIGTDSNEEEKISSQNFSVLSVQQKVFTRSNITGFLINKVDGLNNKYNRNTGLEYNLLSKNNLWRGKFFYVKSFTDNQKENAYAYAASINFNNRYWSISNSLERVNDNFNAEVGFVQRRAYYRINPRVGYNFLPSSGKILSHGPSLFYFSYFNENFKPNEYTYGISYNVELRNKSNFSFFTARDYVKLLNDFDPTNLTGIKLKAGSEHYWRSLGFFYNSKPQSLFTYNFESRYGGYYSDGKRLRLASNLGYRFQPYVQLGISAEINDIKFPEEEELTDANFWLIGPRLDITLTNNFYFTTFLQYNQQIKNTNVNARLQWRYKPVSDIYLVYTENYNIDQNLVKNRAVVLKATYWGNI